KVKAMASPEILEIRRKGLMIGLQLPEGRAAEVQKKLFADHVLVGNCGGNTLRILPPLIITKADIDKFITKLEAALA
ncbi:MAG: aminotransferase class III-fold pyridoxal phosphate-dependent enzyme, partial [Clostridia bacterium]